MTETMHKPEGAESPPTAQAVPTGVSKLGPMGYGGGPVLAAGVMVGGALLFAGWGVVQMASADEGFLAALQDKPAASAAEVPGNAAGEQEPSGGGTVTLPDADGDGIPDGYTENGKTVTPGRGDEDKDESNSTAPEKPAPKPTVYTIEWGDTLSEISEDTGVPLDILVEENGIQNPNLIYAGASLLIPPV